MTTKGKQPEMTKGYPIFEWGQVYQLQKKTTRHKVKKMKYIQPMKTITMMESLKMEKTKKALKKRHMKTSSHQTGIMIQVTTSSKIKTKITKKTHEGQEKMIEDEDIEQPEEIETNQYERGI